MNVLIEFSLTLLLAFAAGGFVVIFARLGVLRQSGLHAISFQQAKWVLLGLFVFYTFFVGGMGILRHLAVSTGNDHAQYDQLIWNSLNGRLLENTFVPDAHLFLGKSFTPILIALVPTYAVWHDPLMLLVFQTLALGVAVLPLFWFARAQLGNGWALVIAFSYLIYTPVVSLNILDFHEIVIATPSFAFATFFLSRRHYVGMLVCLLLAFMVKEEVSFTIVAFGVFIFLAHKKRVPGLALIASGIVSAIALLQVVIPFFHGQGGGFYYFGSGVYAGGKMRYAYLGSNVSQIITTIVTRPDIVWQHVVTLPKAEFVLHFLVPLVFMPLVGLELAAIALPAFGYTLLSDYPYQTLIWDTYTPPMIPFMFFGAVLGLTHILNRGANESRWVRSLTFAVVILVASVLSYYFQSPTLLGRHLDIKQFTMSEHRSLIREIARTIPADAVVVAQNELLPYLSQRRGIYEIPIIPDYRQADYLIADTTREYFQVHLGFWQAYLSSGYFQIVDQPDGYLIAKRQASEHRVDARLENGLSLIGFTIPLTETLRGGTTLRPILEWQVDSPVDARYAAVMRMIDKQDRVWAESDHEPQDGHLPTTRWLPGKLIGDQFELALPPTMPAGDYTLTLGLHKADEDDLLPLFDLYGQNIGNEIELQVLHIEKDKRAYTASQLPIERPLFADMRELRFLGTTNLPATIRADDVLPVGLYWRARQQPQEDYLFNVQLRDVNNRVAVEQSARPAKGTYPTTQWEAGEVLLDWHDLAINSLPPGTYRLWVSSVDSRTLIAIGETAVAEIDVIR